MQAASRRRPCGVRMPVWYARACAWMRPCPSITSRVTALPKRDSKPTQREPSQVFTTQGPAKPSTKALVAAELPPEIPGLKLSVMEQQLLQPKDFVFHTRVAWQRAQPKLQLAQREAIRLGGIAYQKARPLLLRAFAKMQALTLRCMQALAQRMRARSQAAAAKAAKVAPAPVTTDAA